MAENHPSTRTCAFCGTPSDKRFCSRLCCCRWIAGHRKQRCDATPRHKGPASTLRRDEIPQRRIDEFWSHVRKGDGCWEWQAGVAKNGYGRFKFCGKDICAHVASYILEHGSVPEGKYVLHTCDNRKCVNPAHLFAGTHLENIADMTAKKRNLRGPRHPWTKFSDEQIREVLAARKTGERVVSIARRLGMYWGYVYEILRGESRQDAA